MKLRNMLTPYRMWN